MKKKNCKSAFSFKKVNLILALFLINISIYGQTTIVFNEDFENGIGSWFADNGLWDAGIATVGPANAFSGEQVAGTVLNGNFSGGANTRLISPSIALPDINSDENIQLKFWQWFRFSDDNGRIQISVSGGAWETISDPLFDGTSTNWTQHIADLTLYANSVIRIAFYFNSGNFNTDNGWYVDDISVEVEVTPFNNPEGFELGVGDWSADNGLWEIGVPTVGPANAHSGQQVAGTVLNGNFHGSANTRLISPEVILTPLQGQIPTLFFWQWYRFSDDNGRIQISVNGGAWETISDPLFDGTSNSWTQYAIDLSSYSDSTIRIAFYFNSGNFNTDNGWYIDDIRIEGIDSTDVVNGVINANQNEFELLQNYPNPLNTSTTISYQLAKPSHLELTIYNAIGQKIRTLVNGKQPPGEHQIQWDGKNEKLVQLPQGIYHYSLRIGTMVQTKTMVILD